MARPNQKWTFEEEEALSVGVEKYGLGRWKNILDDPQFASLLANRSNIDLKDKWRNLSVSEYGSSSRGNASTPSGQAINNLLLTDPEPSRTSVKRRKNPQYKAMIYEALSSIKDPNGIDVDTITSFLEPKYELPKNFKRELKFRLRKLVLNGDLEKVENRYKIKDMSSGAATSQLDNVWTNTVDNHNEELAANIAAFLVFEAEQKEANLIKTCEDRDKLAELLEESTAMLMLAEELHRKCVSDEVVVLSP